MNFDKSTLVTWQKENSWVTTMAAHLGCKVEKLPMKYLGLPIGVSCKSIKHWKPMVETFKQRLVVWKYRLLSKAGRLQFLKNVLNSLLLYYMSIFKLPKAVVR